MGAQRRQRGEAVGGRSGEEARGGSKGEEMGRSAFERGRQQRRVGVALLSPETKSTTFFFSFLVHDPPHTTTATHTHSYRYIYTLHPNSLRHPSNHPTPSCSLRAGWTLNSVAATFLHTEEEEKGGGAL